MLDGINVLGKYRLQISSRLAQGIMIFAIMAIGVFARVWQYREVPPGLNVDEASIGVDSYDVYKYGMDRNGVTYPVQFIAFGQEQNALYGYLLIPLIAVFGLKTTVLRLPMLLYGLMTLPLLYVIIRRFFNERLALLSMFFLAISPWHIMISRWGLDQNMFPFVLTLGFASLLESSRDNRWFIVGCFFLALCFYIYGPSYFIVPFFLLPASALLLKKKLLDWKFFGAGIVLFGLLAIPIALFLIVNTFHLSSIHIGLITIPRLPTSVPRFLSETHGFQTQPLQTLLTNVSMLGSILVLQTDGLIYNVVEPYGYFYGVTFPLVVLGVIVLIKRLHSPSQLAAAFLLFWLADCIVFGIVQYVSINRLNTVFIPLIICIAVAIDWLSEKRWWVIPLTIIVLLIGFVSFSLAYHGESYLQQAGAKFRPGLVPAIHFASHISQGPMCVTDEPAQAYIFVLFAEQLDPRSYLKDITYVSSTDPERHVASMGRYTFGKSSCALRPLPVYVLIQKEIPPQLGNKYAVKFFENYVVYYPKP